MITAGTSFCRVQTNSDEVASYSAVVLNVTELPTWDVNKQIITNMDKMDDSTELLNEMKQPVPRNYQTFI